MINGVGSGHQLDSHWKSNIQKSTDLLISDTNCTYRRYKNVENISKYKVFLERGYALIIMILSHVSFTQLNFSCKI